MAQLWASAVRLLLPCAGLIAALILRYLWPDLAAEFGVPPDHFLPNIGGPFLSTVAVGFAALLVVRLLDIIVWEYLIARRSGTAVPDLLVNLGDLAIWMVALGIVNHFILGLPPGVLLTSSGLVVAVLAFALKNMISDLFSGIALTLEHPYRIGTWVEVSTGVVGRVQSMSWRATSLKLLNGVTLIMPHSRMTEQSLRIYNTWSDTIEIELPATVTGDEAEALLLPAAANIARLHGVPPPTAACHEFGASGVKWRLYYWVPDYPGRSAMRDKVMRNLVEALHKAGLSSATPRQVVELTSPPAA